jgi:citrate lyase beta subunit
LGKWAFRYKGQMVDVPNLKRAHAILERARIKEENDTKWRRV